jgi:plasmid stabilization system protein ParE
MNIFLSPLAERQLEHLLDFLEFKWSRKTRNDFLDKIKKSFDQISFQPKSCKKSNILDNLYECIVAKQTSFYYRILMSEIEIISVKDNRRDPKKIEEELKYWR